MAFLVSDREGIQTPNPQSRNLMRYSVAPRGRFSRSKNRISSCYINALRQLIFNNFRYGLSISLSR